MVYEISRGNVEHNLNKLFGKLFSLTKYRDACEHAFDESFVLRNIARTPRINN